MSEHEWVQENVAIYSAGGLERNERDRLEKHVAKCADCRRALDEMREVDQKVGSLFANPRPSAALEDRMIQSLRKKGNRPWRPHWLVASAAAVFVMGVVGILTDK